MNKYQEFAIRQIKIYGDENLKSFKWNFDKIVLEQNENYNLTKYTILIDNTFVAKVEYFKADELCVGCKTKENYHTLELDFNEKIESIRLHFALDIVDPVDIKVEYIDADKSIYDKKLQLEHQKQLDEKAKVNVKTGDSIINVIFQPINNSFSYSEVELYSVASSKIINGKTENEYQLLAKYKTPKDIFFNAITGLAYGSYAVILIQYNDSQMEIYRSDFIHVDLSRPYFGKSIVSNS